MAHQTLPTTFPSSITFQHYFEYTWKAQKRHIHTCSYLLAFPLHIQTQTHEVSDNAFKTGILQGPSKYGKQLKTAMPGELRDGVCWIKRLVLESPKVESRRDVVWRKGPRGAIPRNWSKIYHHCMNFQILCHQPSIYDNIWMIAPIYYIYYCPRSAQVIWWLNFAVLLFKIPLPYNTVLFGLTILVILNLEKSLFTMKIVVSQWYKGTTKRSLFVTDELGEMVRKEISQFLHTPTSTGTPAKV